jgi:hypothetical protein
MRAKYLFIAFLFLSAKSYSQFLKNEKLIGGNLDIYTIREKNPSATTGGPFGNTSTKETDFSFRPEFSYIVSKNTGVSIFGEFLSSKYSNDPAANEYKTKGFTVGVGLSKYKFFTEGFGIFGKLQMSYSPSWTRYSDTTATFYPKDKYYLTNISLLPGLFYKFSKHFSLQATIGRVSYEHLVSKREGFDESKIHNQFSASFSNISFGAFYIFK